MFYWYTKSMTNLGLDRRSLVPLAKKQIPEGSPFWRTAQPVLWLAAHGLVKAPKSYYADIAALFGWGYTEDLPVRMDDSRSTANIIGSEKLSAWQFFVFEQSEAVVVACADPFAKDVVASICQEALGSDVVLRFVIAPLGSIRTAIAQSTYKVATSRAETSLDFARPEYSSRGKITRSFRITLLIAVAIALLILFWSPPLGFLVFFTLINAAYFVLNPLRLVVCLGALRFKPINIQPARLSKLQDEQLPPYTILVPAKQEATVVPQLIVGLRAIDYPADKLDIKLIVEVDDHETIAAYKEQGITEQDHANSLNTIFQLVKVPTSDLSTKPRSCNYALQFARGQLTVIYDAEDKPDVLQLKKAYATMVDEKLNTLCVQAKLNFYNAKQNLLTRFFSLEYGFWYDFMLPGLQAWNIPIPLGGTSNHFITGTLRKIGTWDPYNVTEDADIGWRLSQLGYRTTMLDSYTLEEANSQLWNWITQRTRWQKGFLLTTMVHLRHPVRMWRQLGAYGFLSSATLFTTNFLLPLVNPILWVFFICWYVPPLFGLAPIGFTLPDWLHTLGAINLIIGNGTFMLVHLIAAIGKRQWSQILLVPLMPLYWLLTSVASYRSVVQVITKPYTWEKTKHGLR